LAGSLASARAGEEVCVQAVSADTCHARRLRELGLFEGKTIRVLASGNPLICQVGECRIGICQRLARCVAVELVPSTVPAKSA
jgi:Fe2+ transport system protein FeoA